MTVGLSSDHFFKAVVEKNRSPIKMNHCMLSKTSNISSNKILQQCNNRIACKTLSWQPLDFYEIFTFLTLHKICIVQLWFFILLSNACKRCILIAEMLLASFLKFSPLEHDHSDLSGCEFGSTIVFEGGHLIEN